MYSDTNPGIPTRCDYSLTVDENTWIRCKFKKSIYNMIQGYFVQEVVGAVKPVHYEQST